MSSLNSTSSQLGSYLLRGWTLLDQSCSVCLTPLVRSPPPDRQLLCVRCGRDTTTTTSNTTTTTNSLLPNETHSSPSTSIEESNRPPATYHPFVNGDDMDSDEDEQEAGVMEVELRGQTNTESARREQSDRASKLIGDKLLQGYCLLDEICQTETCYGVPLLRLPRETVRRMCVICQKIYPETIEQPTPGIMSAPAATAIPIPPVQDIVPPPPFPLQAFPWSTSMLGQTSKEVLEKAYRNLAGELVRLTESLSNYDTASKEYEDCLKRVQRVVEILHSMRKQ